MWMFKFNIIGESQEAKTKISRYRYPCEAQNSREEILAKRRTGLHVRFIAPKADFGWWRMAGKIGEVEIDHVHASPWILLRIPR